MTASTRTIVRFIGFWAMFGFLFALYLVGQVP